MLAPVLTALYCSPTEVPLRTALLEKYQPQLTKFARLRVRLTVMVSVLLLTREFLVGNRPTDLTQWQLPEIAGAWLLVLAGLALRSSAAGVLHKSQTLAQYGPYAVCRHPLYLGSLLIFLGIVMFFRERAAWLLLCLSPLLLPYITAIRLEELKLSNRFGAAWTSYIRRGWVESLLQQRPAEVAGWSLAVWWKNREYRLWIGVAAGLLAMQLASLQFLAF